MCPAVGQGALAIEARSGDTETLKHLEFLNHPETRSAIECERAVLGSLGGGCQVPIGAFAEKRDDLLHLRAIVGRPDGSEILREFGQGSDPQRLGCETAQKLLKRGADKILSEVYNEEVAVPRQP
jgi:hydroxymethylbilane synthase